MPRVTITGDQDEDRDYLVGLLLGFREVYDEFDAIPTADNAADLSSWTQVVYARCNELENHYGERTATRVIQSAWQEARQ